MTPKLYCVTVYQPYDYLIEADSPRDAEDRVIAANWSGDYADIARIDVRRQCACGNANELTATTCDDCGAEL
jgi:hypothetical protein